MEYIVSVVAPRTVTTFEQTRTLERYTKYTALIRGRLQSCRTSAFLRCAEAKHCAASFRLHHRVLLRDGQREKILHHRAPLMYQGCVYIYIRLDDCTRGPLLSPSHPRQRHQSVTSPRTLQPRARRTHRGKIVIISNTAMKKEIKDIKTRKSTCSLTSTDRSTQPLSWPSLRWRGLKTAPSCG